MDQYYYSTALLEELAHFAFVHRDTAEGRRQVATVSRDAPDFHVQLMVDSDPRGAELVLSSVAKQQ